MTWLNDSQLPQTPLWCSQTRDSGHEEVASTVTPCARVKRGRTGLTEQSHGLAAGMSRNQLWSKVLQLEELLEAPEHTG